MDGQTSCQNTEARRWIACSARSTFRRATAFAVRTLGLCVFPLCFLAACCILPSADAYQSGSSTGEDSAESTGELDGFSATHVIAEFASFGETLRGTPFRWEPAPYLESELAAFESDLSVDTLLEQYLLVSGSGWEPNFASPAVLQVGYSEESPVADSEIRTASSEIPSESDGVIQQAAWVDEKSPRTGVLLPPSLRPVPE